MNIRVISGTRTKGAALESSSLVPINAEQPPVLEEVPPMPAYLPNAWAIKTWNDLAPWLTRNKLLTEGGVPVLALYCALHGQVAENLLLGETVKAATYNTLGNLASKLGLTYSEFSKMRPREKEQAAETNPFAGNGNRVA